MDDGVRTRGTVAAALVVLLAAAGCASGADRSAAAECAAAGVTMTAPAVGTVVGSGPVTLAAAAHAPGSTVLWTLRDNAGAEVASGSTVGAGDPEGTVTVPLDLPAGSWTVDWRSGASPDSSCPVASSPLEVGEPGAPRWAAGASGGGVVDGSFAAWRGSPVTMAGSWSDKGDGQVELWPLQDEFADWTGDLDLAVGAINAGETWAAAAQGAYDGRWSESLREAARLWSGHEGTLYLRFAHEFNGDWYPWSVTAATVGDFIAGWHRFRALQQQLFPAAQLVFAPNSESVAAFGTDWRQAFPGAGQVDVLSMSWFNAYPFSDTAAEFQDVALRFDQFGGPRGIQRHLEFARSVGLPFAVSEWGVYVGFGDSASWVEQMYGFFNANAGSEPGQLRYEVLFNVARNGNESGVFPDTRVPNTAEDYARLW